MEQRQLTVHPAILYSIIKSQAGSLSKALLEAVMNAVDAGATKCSIKLDSNSFEVKDNGKGFSSRQEILDFFETFGTPHTEGDARYGKFRMGRGQMFSFGINTWQTGHFTMVVDIKGKGLDYSLKEDKKVTLGCHIKGQLYEAMPAYQLQDCITELKKFIQYVEIPVSVNGTVVSKKPEDQKWDLVTDDAYIKLNNSSSLAVYNLGVLVRDYGSYLLGSGGVVVSRKQLEVNFARNDILQHSCKVWGRVREHVRTISGAKVAKKASLTDSERQFLADQLTSSSDLDWKNWSSLVSAYTVPTASSRHGTVKQMLEASVVVLVPPAYKRLGERLHRAKAFFGVTEDTLARFNASDVHSMLTTLASKSPYSRDIPAIGNFEDFLKTHKAGYQTLGDQELKPFELLAIKTLRNAHSRFFPQWFAKLKGADYEPVARYLRVGSSDSALAWTNGTDSIHLEQRFLSKQAKKGLNGWHRIATVLLHEYCHPEPDMEGHEHDQNFFERFEELATQEACVIGEFVAWVTNEFINAAVAAGLPLPRQQLVSASKVQGIISADEPEREGAALAAKPVRQKAKPKAAVPPVALPGQLSLF